MKGFAIELALIQRQKATQKWTIERELYIHSFIHPSIHSSISASLSLCSFLPALHPFLLLPSSRLLTFLFTSVVPFLSLLK